jgi:hypothetical protein
MKLQLALLMKRVLIFLFLPFAISASSAQVKYHTMDYVNLLVSGTSMLHDWDMKSAKGTCICIFSFNNKGEMTGLSSLKFTTPAESLKSGHTGMDNNAYKALNTGAYPTISFMLVNAIVNKDSILCNGNLTIAGVTNVETFSASYRINKDKSITISGAKKLVMSDFKIEPPSFMMGTIKTGNEINFKFDLTLSR